VLDVTVTDSHGQPVRALKSADFHIFEDGAAQTLRSFDVHASEAQEPVKLPDLPPNTFANLSSSPSTGPVTVVLYDLLNTPLDSQPYARAELLEFLKNRKHSGQVAIFVLSDRLHMLQGFTEQDDLLVAALNSQKNHRSGLLQGQEEASQGSTQLAGTDGNQAGAAPGANSSFTAMTAMLTNMETSESSYLLDQRVNLTAEALQQIARFLVGLPGRKNLLWLSASFPAGVIPDSGANGRDPISGQNEFSATRNYSDAIRAATNLLNDSHVAVYPIDARGLQVDSMFSAAGRQTFEPGTGKDVRAVQNFGQQQASEHATMDVIGNETGGRAFYNTNGLTEAAQEAVNDGSFYYTVSYSPTNKGTDTKLRRIRVELTTPGYHLAYRRSYFAEGSEASPTLSAEKQPDTLGAALEHGAPMSHELFFEVHLRAHGQPMLATPEQVAELAKYEGAASKGRKKAADAAKQPPLMQSYVVEYALLPRQLALRVGEDQKRRDDLEFAAASFNDDGLLVSGTRTEIHDVIDQSRWEEVIASGGYHVPLAIQVPVETRSLRLAVLDRGTGRVGSLELRLPLAPEAAPDATQGQTSR
jgi:VWFA-related protein